MTDNNNEQTNETTADTKQRVVKHRDVKIAELQEDIQKVDERRATLQGKLDALLREAAAEEAIANIEAGALVSYVFGRAPQRRILSGTVRAVGKNAAGVVQLKVEHGEGLDAEFHLIDGGALLLDYSAIRAAREEVAKANAEALAKKNKDEEKQS